MDLLGGVTGLVALTAALIQILPSPVRLCHHRLQHFLDWLKDSIESDFCVSLYTCTNKCHTQTYEPNSESLRRRILTSIGEADSVGCTGNEHLTVDDLVEVMQTGGNAKTLLELARLARYPEMGKLRRAIRTVYYSPTNGRSVTVIQWMGFLSYGLAYWLVSTGIPPAWRRFWRVVFNIVRRVRGRRPIHRGDAKARAVLNYRIAGLARHRIVFQHVPWVRYALYYMLTEMAKRRLSARSWSMDETRASVACSQHQPNEHAHIFNHVMLGERRLVTRMATDECSAARLLYSNALHSLRVLLLCEAVAYVPQYLQTSSFRMVERKLTATMLVATHSRMDAVYRALFDEIGGKHPASFQMMAANTDRNQDRVYVHASYDILLKRLQSKLGRMVVDGCEIYVLLNLTLLHLDLPGLNSPANAAALPELEIDGVQIPVDLLQKLIVGRDATGAKILESLELFRSTDIYWGSTIWLLYMLRTAYEKFSITDLTARDRQTGENTFLTICSELILLCSSPFQPYVSPNFNAAGYAIDRRHDLLVPMGSWDVLKSSDYCNSMPAWCTCTDHCPGICTLIVNELTMDIAITKHFVTPYLFRMSFPCGPGEAGIVTTLRLVCATSWDAGALVTLKDYQGSSVPQPRSRLEAWRTPFDLTTYALSDVLYSKDRVVVVIDGGDILVHKLDPSTATAAAGGIGNRDRWPFNLESRQLTRKLGSTERIIVPNVIGLMLDPFDAFTEQVVKEITLSDSRLRYMARPAEKNMRSLRRPFRSRGPRLGATVATIAAQALMQNGR
ncbi:hypothetical protein GGF42_000059 [Coemansia sp. RSA 2424]|nr:hypothetical protein GGF42_000059 [Coemansia sp. RSA 2424]